MLGFLSFIIVVSMALGSIGLIMHTIRNSFDLIGSALRGDAHRSVTFVTFSPRVVRRPVVTRLKLVPLRAAA